MRLTKKEPTADFDDIDIPPAPTLSYGTTLSDSRPFEGIRQKDIPAAVIGAKITLKGELSGDEDIMIEGHVEGSVKFDNHHLIVGEKGEIKADSKAKSVTILGSMDGDVEATDIISVKKGSKVNGNLKAERINLEDGAKFRGSIDMVEKKGS